MYSYIFAYKERKKERKIIRSRRKKKKKLNLLEKEIFMERKRTRISGFLKEFYLQQISRNKENKITKK